MLPVLLRLLPRLMRSSEQADESSGSARVVVRAAALGV
jgi:hypothetical protein